MTPSKLGSLATGIVCLVGGWAGIVGAQENPPTFASESAQVRLHVAVFDKKGVPIAGLTADDFEIYEEGARQQTAFVFSPGETPVDLAIVLDMSGSMSDSMSAATRAANELADSLDPADCLLFLPFARAIAEPTWTAGGAGVPAISGDSVGSRDQTALTDAILTAQLMLRTRRVDDVARRAGLPVTSSCVGQSGVQGTRRQLMVVVSDGMDSISRASWGSIMDNVLESRVPVISIFAGTAFTSSPRGAWRVFSRRRMEALAVGSGGTFEPLAGDSYGELFERLLRLMRATYVVTFPRTAASHASAAAWRSVEVRVSGTEARIQAPSGYYANGAVVDRVRTSQGLAARILKLGSIDAAVSLLRDAARQAPDSASVHADLAQALELQSESEEALEFTMRATRLRPTTWHTQAARLAMSLGRGELALEQAIRAAQAGDEVGELLDRLTAELSDSELERVRARLEAPRVFLADTGAGDVQTFLRVRETDGMMARLISDSTELALVRDFSHADFFVWFDVEPDTRRLQRDGRTRGRLRLNLPRHLTTPPPKAWSGSYRDSPFVRLRPRTLQDMSIEFEDSMTVAELDSLFRAAIVELEGWIRGSR